MASFSCSVFDVSERTVSRWMKRTLRDPDLAQRWLTFLRNHREAIAAMDFFTVATVRFGELYCFFVPQPQSSTYSPLQRHQASDDPVDRPTVAGSVSV